MAMVEMGVVKPLGGGSGDRLPEKNVEPRSTLHSVPALSVCRHASEATNGIGTQRSVLECISMK